MYKVLIGFALFVLSCIANAVPVTLLVYNQSSGNGTISTLITDGSHISGIAAASTATFDWDGTILSSVGLFTATSSIGSSQLSDAILSDQYTDLSIDTSINQASAAAYACVEGTFLGNVGVNGCGGYNFGANYTDDSTTVWGPGTAVTQTIGGDDVLTIGARTISWTDEMSIFTLISGVDGLTPGDVFSIGNGVSVGSPNGHAMVFQVVPVPAAVWLFGSALGLLGWMRHRYRSADKL